MDQLYRKAEDNDALVYQDGDADLQHLDNIKKKEDKHACLFSRHRNLKGSTL